MIIIVLGLPGSGKSFFASRLAQRLSAHYINSDAIRKAMGAWGKYTFEDKRAVYLRMRDLTREGVLQGNDVVVDATFYRKELRDLFLRLADEMNTTLRFIRIHAVADIVKERLSKPRENSEADYAVYQTLKGEYEEITEPHFELVSQQDNIEEMISKAVHYIHSSS